MLSQGSVSPSDVVMTVMSHGSCLWSEFVDSTESVGCTKLKLTFAIVGRIIGVLGRDVSFFVNTVAKHLVGTSVRFVGTVPISTRCCHRISGKLAIVGFGSLYS